MNEDIALLCERVLTGRIAEGDAEAWNILRTTEPLIADNLIQTVRLHRLLTVALAGPTAVTVAQHAIQLAAAEEPGQRQRAVGASIQRLQRLQRLQRHRQQRSVALAVAALLMLGVAIFLSTGSVFSNGPALVPAFTILAAPKDAYVRDAQGVHLTGNDIPVGASLSGTGRWDLRSLDGRVALALNGSSQMVVTTTSMVRLEQGELQASVTPGSPELWRFATPHAEARILGTQFTLSVANRGTKLVVTAGVVEFKPMGQESFTVATGASAQAEESAATLWQVDEQRTPIPGWSVGSATRLRGPEGRSAFCGDAMLPENGPGMVAVGFAAPEATSLFVAPVGSQIAADVWLDVNVSGPLTIMGWELNAEQNYEVALMNPPRGRWFSLLVPVADLKPVFPERGTGPWRRPRTRTFIVSSSHAGSIWVARTRLLTP